MKRPPVRRVRWRKRESGRFSVLALVEAVKPAALTERDRNELERLDRARRAGWHAGRSREERRILRRSRKHTARAFAEFDRLSEQWKRDNLTLTWHNLPDTVPPT